MLEDADAYGTIHVPSAFFQVGLKAHDDDM